MEETIVVECSRQSSIESTTGNNSNPAEWTCDCGSGIVLDIGDKIQVHSGYISEKGAQAGQIEIKDRSRSDVIQVEISKDIQYVNPISPTLPSATNQVLDWSEIYKYAGELGGNEEIPIEINDSEINIVYSPYKTANGEFYATLPRCFIGTNHADTHVINKNPYNIFDASLGTYSTSRWAAGAMGNIIFNLDGENPDYDNNFKEAWQFCPADYKLTMLNNQTYLPNTPLPIASSERKGMILNDNSRYTLFRAKSVYRNASAALANGGNIRANLGGDDTHTTEGPGTSGYQDAYDLRDPAILYEWEQVKELVKIKSKSGFNSPKDVSVDLTEQLNLRGDAKKFSVVHKTLANPPKYIEKELYKTYESPCYKAYNCATSNWDYDRWKSFKDVQDTTTSQLNNAHNYMSMYQHIGIKRPDLHIQGRKTNTAVGFLKPAVEHAGGQTPHNAQVLNLGLEWTPDNIKLLNDLFNVQANYDELFTGVEQEGPHNNGGYFDITPGKHRFLHFNKQDELTNSTDFEAGRYSHCPHNSLGYDLYPTNASLPPESEGFYHYDNTMATYPIFFDYNASTANLTENDVSYCEDSGGGVSDINQLAYGWARKVRIEASLAPSGKEKFYIGVQFTHTGNGVPEFLYNGMTHIAEASVLGNTGRRFGWDWHFSAYGNPCMVLYSGLVNTFTADNLKHCNDETVQYKVSQSIDDVSDSRNVAGGYHQILLGADNPGIGYDENEDRFYFTNLHMSEKLGNPSDGGKPASSGTATDGVNANPNADTSVYKVNKRLLGTNYCPNSAPYNASLLVPANAALQYPAQLIFSNNLEPGVPYDAQGGMFIEQIAVPENIWDSNLIGVLGFQYSQFTNTDTSRQVSIKDRLNATNMKFLTTQAPINVADLLTWNKNGYGNTIFTITATPNYTRSQDKHTQHTDVASIYPPITVEFNTGADSTRITALDLPTKTARPYYAIRSDIIPQNQFFGGNQDLTKKTAGAVNSPIVAIINKTNGYGDFYSAEFNMLEFTNTQKRVITTIKTSVCDPDGSYAQVDLSSSVIYKIIKTKDIDLTPLKTLLESKNKKQVEQGQTIASMLKDPKNLNPNFIYALQNLISQQPAQPINPEEFFAEEVSF